MRKNTNKKEDKNYIQVKGLEFRNLKSIKVNETPIGTYITGTGSHIEISNNYIHHIEANVKNGNAHGIAVNGNVDSFEVINNKVHDNNNIGIVLIGHEGVSPVAALDQARNEIIRNNIVHHNSSITNTSYYEYSADGIYVDGGK